MGKAFFMAQEERGVPMLFHVTMTHSVENCPGFHPEKMPAMLDAAEKAEEIGRQCNVKVHFFLNGLPEHVMFALLEADSPAAVAQYLASIPLPQDFKVTPVVTLEETVVHARAMMAQG